jgi:hypothetical protein
MAHNNQYTKAAKAKRAAAAKRAWITIRANKAAQAKNKTANAAITPATLQKAVDASAKKIAAKAAA